MRRFLKSTSVFLLLSLVAGTSTVWSQESGALLKEKQNNGGLTNAESEHFFGKFKPRELSPLESLVDLQDHVREFRVFLTDKENIVRAEIEVEKPGNVHSFELELEKGATKFNDLGEAPDQKAQDGVFTATLQMDTRSDFRSMQQNVFATVRNLRNQDGSKLIRRGPRDIVPVTAFVEDLKKRAPKIFELAIKESDRFANVLEAQPLADVPKALELDAGKTPFLRIPGPRSASISGLRFTRFFDFPIFEPFPLPQTTVAVDQSRSLMITDVNVVDDPLRTFDSCTNIGTPGGVWSFGYLMRQMAQGTNLNPEQYALEWLSNWQLPQSPNGVIFNEPGRGAQLQNRIIDSWQQISALNAPGGTLNVDYFPARLMAIVNRPDLADRIGYGSAGSAGEGRFVFGLVSRVNAGPSTSPCFTLPFTVIFEYGLKGGSCQAVKTWQQSWKDLDLLPIDQTPIAGKTYNEALEAVTHRFTDFGTNPSSASPNQNSLNQLRTNENALDPEWQLLEFKFDSAGVLELDTVKQNPIRSFNNSATLQSYGLANKADILADRHLIPAKFPGITPFLAANSNVPFPPTGPSSQEFWSFPNPSAFAPDESEVRRKLSLSTCNACHGRETETFFTHIGDTGKRNLGFQATLSTFLTGGFVDLPDGSGNKFYSDLAEREIKMSNILSQPCFRLLSERKIHFTE